MIIGRELFDFPYTLTLKSYAYIFFFTFSENYSFKSGGLMLTLLSTLSVPTLTWINEQAIM